HRHLVDLVHIQRGRDRGRLRVHELSPALDEDGFFQSAHLEDRLDRRRDAWLHRTSSSTAVLNPTSETVTVYVPVSRDGTTKSPRASVTVLKLAPDAVFVTVTVAPGMKPPAVSTAVPDSDALTPPCARASVGTIVAKM